MIITYDHAPIDRAERLSRRIINVLLPEREDERSIFSESPPAGCLLQRTNQLSEQE